MSWIILPSGEPLRTASRSRSPAERCTRPNSSTSRSQLVPLPDPGPPSTNTMRRSLAPGAAELLRRPPRPTHPRARCQIPGLRGVRPAKLWRGRGGGFSEWRHTGGGGELSPGEAVESPHPDGLLMSPPESASTKEVIDDPAIPAAANPNAAGHLEGVWVDPTPTGAIKLFHQTAASPAALDAKPRERDTCSPPNLSAMVPLRCRRALRVPLLSAIVTRRAPQIAVAPFRPLFVTDCT